MNVSTRQTSRMNSCLFRRCDIGVKSGSELFMILAEGDEGVIIYKAGSARHPYNQENCPVLSAINAGMRG